MPKKAVLQETFDAAVKENQDEFGMEVNMLTFCGQLMQPQQKALFPALSISSCFGAARGSNAECGGRVQASGEFCCV